MRRGATPQGVQEEAKALPGVLGGKGQGAKDLLLHGGVVDADGSSSHLTAVEYQVVGPGADPPRGAVEKGEVFGHRGGKGVVHRHPAPLVLIPLEQGKLRHPKETPPLLHEAPGSGQLQPKLPQHGAGLEPIVVGHHEEDVPILQARGLHQGSFSVGPEELDQGAFEGSFFPREGPEPGGPQGLGPGLHFGQFLAGHDGPPRHGEAPHRSAPGQHAPKGLHGGGGKDALQGADLEGDPKIGLVDAVAIHGLGPGHTGKGGGNFFGSHLPVDAPDVPFQQGVDVFFGDEAHLQVHLGEFGLAIRPEVFVPKALDDLHVSVAAAYHQYLLKELRGLGKGIEVPRVDPTRHQVVPGSLGGGAGEHGGLHLHKALGRKVISGKQGRPGTNSEVGLHALPPQVQVTMAQAQVFVHLVAVVDLEGQGAAGGKEQ